MGAFTGACLLALAGAALVASERAMEGGTIGAIVGAILGFAVGLWLVLRQGGQWGGAAVAGLTGVAVMMVICFGFVAFS
jgi:hypothetical protein